MTESQLAKNISYLDHVNNLYDINRVNHRSTNDLKSSIRSKSYHGKCACDICNCGIHRCPSNSTFQKARYPSQMKTTHQENYKPYNIINNDDTNKYSNSPFKKTLPTSSNLQIKPDKEHFKTTKQLQFTNPWDDQDWAKEHVKSLLRSKASYPNFKYSRVFENDNAYTQKKIINGDSSIHENVSSMTPTKFREPSQSSKISNENLNKHNDDIIQQGTPYRLNGEKSPRPNYEKSPRLIRESSPNIHDEGFRKKSSPNFKIPQYQADNSSRKDLNNHDTDRSAVSKNSRSMAYPSGDDPNFSNRNKAQETTPQKSKPDHHVGFHKPNQESISSSIHPSKNPVNLNSINEDDFDSALSRGRKKYGPVNYQKSTQYEQTRSKNIGKSPVTEQKVMICKKPQAYGKTNGGGGVYDNGTKRKEIQGEYNFYANDGRNLCTENIPRAYYQDTLEKTNRSYTPKRDITFKVPEQTRTSRENPLIDRKKFMAESIYNVDYKSSTDLTPENLRHRINKTPDNLKLDPNARLYDKTTYGETHNDKVDDKLLRMKPAGKMSQNCLFYNDNDGGISDIDQKSITPRSIQNTHNEEIKRSENNNGFNTQSSYKDTFKHVLLSNFMKKECPINDLPKIPHSTCNQSHIYYNEVANVWE